MIRSLTYGNIWISLAMTSLTISSFLMIDKRIEITVLLIVFLSTYSGYNLQSYIATKTSNNKSEINYWKLENLKKLLILIILSACIVAALSIYIYSIKQLILLFPFFLIVLFYRLKIFGFSFRNIPVLKIILISICFGALSFFLPYLYYDVPLNHFSWSLILANSLFVFSITIPFDIRDLKYDSYKYKTLPQILGLKMATFVACLAMIVCQILYINNLFYFISILGLLSCVLIIYSHKPKSAMFYLIVLDGLLILHPVFILLEFLF